MSTPALTTKLYIPPTRPELVSRPHLIEQLNGGLHRKLTLISAPAGFGKTTLVSEWVAGCERPVAWLSLDEGDNDTTRFLAYLIAALQMIMPAVGKGILDILQSPQPPPPEVILPTLLNDLAAIPENFILVLDDYHLIDCQSIDQALLFLIEHQPPGMHLAITTREDPQFPLARLRARDQLTELRVKDLRFTPSEAAEFLNQVMGLDLSSEEVASLEMRTEGWIAGLQLAALSMQGSSDISSFVKSFTGSHHFVMDYLIEEVLHRQTEAVQAFLIHTSILDRLCGPLCDALTRQNNGQQTLEYLEQANLFIVSLDNERRWYRYHHLFAGLLRQRLNQNTGSSPEEVSELHCRASQWYEDNGMEIEAFRHAAAANNVDRAACLVEGNGMHLHFRGVVTPVLTWLESLPTAVLDARPSLWVMYASALWVASQPTQVESKLQAAEAALQGIEPDDKINDLIGHIAAIRAMLAGPQYQVETIITQAHRALEYLHPDNLPVRTAATWALGIAYQFQGDRSAARETYIKAISISEASRNAFINILATTGLGIIQETENQLYQAAQSYRRVLQIVGDPPLPMACEAYLGLARLSYEWNDLNTAQQHGQQSIELARQIENIDSTASSGVFLARLSLAQGDIPGATALLAEAGQSVRQHDFVQLMPEVAAVQVLILISQGNLDAAANLAEEHDLPISRARVHLAEKDPAAALAVLGPYQEQMTAKSWADEQLKTLVLQAIAHHVQGDVDRAIQLLGEALTRAAPGGFIRLFVDKGPLMADLLTEAAARGLMPDYTGRLLAAFDAANELADQPLIDPLSDRELEVLHLIADGLSNHDIADRLFLALPTVKGHNRSIYSKLGVQRRTEAVARARELGLLS